MKKTRRFLSIMLSILLILTVLPMASAPAFAAETTKSLKKDALGNLIESKGLSVYKTYLKKS